MTRIAPIIFLFAGGMVMACGNAPTTQDSPPDPPELQAYIAAVRRSKMTDGAQSYLRSVASIVTGGVLLTFPRDPDSGEYGRGLQSTTCPLPGADSLAVAEWTRELRNRIGNMVMELRALADTDGSGFVTDLEASQLRELVEFGYFVHYLTTSEHATLPTVAEATHLEPEQLKDRVNKYNWV